MRLEKKWSLITAGEVPKHFRDAIGGHPLVAETLYHRGVHTIEAARAFLNPEFYTPTAADELPDIQIAYQLLIDALNTSKRILVWGDFDVDGQTSTTILVEGLRHLGGEVIYHIPVRAVESHGITRAVLTTFMDQGFDLLLTCDTGISEHENIQLLRDAGISVIVTDHHALGETLPPANAIINPQRLPEDHPLRTLPGVGVAFKLIEGLYASSNHPFNAGRYLELAALGIVADVAELHGDTRYLLQEGLESLRQTNRVGLQTLYKNADLIPEHLNEGHIGFQIAPRLNAVGRLSDANIMVDFLTTESPGEARIIAAEIEAMNTKRRFDSRQVKKAAETQLSASSEDRHAPAIVLHHPDWPGGVVGIVAGHLVERYQKPVLLLTGNDPVHGSARSVDDVNVTEAIGTQADLITHFGGHPMAAGLSLPKNHLGAFKRGFLAAVETQTQGITRLPELKINRVLNLTEITRDLIEEIARLAPFGPGNPPLMFLIPNLTLISAADIGQTGEHRQVIASDPDGNQQRFIWWNGGDEPLPEAEFDLVCSLTQTDYKGSLQINAEWVDFRLSEKGVQEIEKRRIAIVDHRKAPAPAALLTSLRDQFPEAAIWAEGDFPESVPGLKRFELKEVEKLIIWTSPPSQDVLQDVLRQTKPDTVIVFGQTPPTEKPEKLLERVAGLVKYTVSHHQGVTTVTKLAATCAATRETIRISLQLLAAMGYFSLDFEDDSVTIALTPSPQNPAAVTILKPILVKLFEESQSFRRFFAKGSLESLLLTKQMENRS